MNDERSDFAGHYGYWGLVAIIGREEGEMVSRSGTPPCLDYMQQVPKFFPRWTAIKALQHANQPPVKQ